MTGDIESASIQTIFKCMSQMSQQELQLFISMNGDFVEAKKLDNQSGRRRETDYNFHFKLSMLST